MNIKSVVVEGNRFNYCDEEMRVPRKAVLQMKDYVDRWCKNLPYVPTYSMEKWGVPCIMARFDGVLDKDGNFEAYELQGGCGWIGYAGVTNPSFREIRDELAANAWPPIKLLIPPALEMDDILWLDRISLREAIEGGDVLMIRKWRLGELPLDQRLALLRRSMKPQVEHHIKRYGIEFGWWKQITAAEADRSLPWDEEFILKPVISSGSRDVMVWTPHTRRGRATRTQILKTIDKFGVMLIQKFIRPMPMRLDEKNYNMILRPFFGFDPRIRSWVPMHGVWTARPEPELRIHGSSDAISGPLLMD